MQVDVFGADNDVLEEIPTCSICLEQIEQNFLYSLNECKHEFHINCLMNWFRNGKKTCPNCRDVGTNNNNIVLFSDIKDNSLFKLKIKYGTTNKNAPKEFKQLIKKYLTLKEKIKVLKKKCNEMRKEHEKIFKEQQKKLTYNEYFKMRNEKHKKRKRLLDRYRKLCREKYALESSIDNVPIKPIYVMIKKRKKLNIHQIQ